MTATQRPRKTARCITLVEMEDATHSRTRNHSLAGIATFPGVKIVSAADLASIPLGKNVTYRAGHNMLKFRTDNKVYAVTKGGVLRWVKTGSIGYRLVRKHMEQDD